jgi:hypothetical protein
MSHLSWPMLMLNLVVHANVLSDGQHVWFNMSNQVVLAIEG